MSEIKNRKSGSKKSGSENDTQKNEKNDKVPANQDYSFNISNFMLLMSIVLLPIIFSFYQSNAETRNVFLYVCGASFVAFAVTYQITPRLANKTVNKLFGKDINKKGTPEGEIKIPESLGFLFLFLGVCVAL